MVMFRQTYLIFTFALLIGASCESSHAQDREGRIETSTDRIETRRRLQQYKEEEKPAPAPLALPAAAAPETQVTRARARTAKRGPASTPFLTSEPTAVRRAEPKRPRIARPVPVIAAPRQSLPRD